VYYRSRGGEKLNVGIMKELSGGDKIQCRALYGSPIEFKPQFNMVMTCNTLPKFRQRRRNVASNQGSGVWFQVRRRTPSTNEFEMDPDLNEKFERWKRPFMVMLIRRYVADKGKKVIEPIQVSAITQRYREEQDHLAAFVKENFQIAEGCEISVKDVHAIYKDWCKVNLAKMKPDQMMTMVTKLKATDMKEPDGVESVPLLRHVYKNWAPMDD
jgi:putative DNA primase/helicase